MNKRDRMRLSKAVRDAVLARAAGRCECGCHAVTDRFEFDHHMPVAEGGETTVENIRALSPTCHRRVTRAFVRGHAKAKRISQKTALSIAIRALHEVVATYADATLGHMAARDVAQEALRKLGEE